MKVVVLQWQRGWHRQGKQIYLLEVFNEPSSSTQRLASDPAQNPSSSFTLMKLWHLGGVSLGPRHMGHLLPMEYKVSAIAFYGDTFCKVASLA